MHIPWKVFLAPSPLALTFAIKTLFAAGLALWLAFRFDLEQPTWAMMTVFIVSQPLSGMVVAKGLFRLMGTVLGTVMSVVLIALFAQAPWAFLLALALWLGFCTAASTLLRNHVSYGFVLAGYTVAIIGLPAIAQPLTIFDQAVARCTEICLGIIVASLVSSLFWPQRVERSLAQQAAGVWQAGLQAVRAEVAGAEASGLLGVFGQIVAVDAQRDHTWFEGYRGRQRARALRLFCRDLLSVLRTARGLARQWNALTPGEREAVQPWREEVLNCLEQMDEATIEALLERLRQAAGESALDNDQCYFLARLGILLRKVLTAAQSVRAVSLGVVDDSAPSALSWHRDLQTSIWYGLRSAIALLGLGVFWLSTAWPAATGAMLLGAVLCSLFANRDNAVQIGLGFLRGIGYAVVSAIIVSQVVLPQWTGFPMLAMAMGIPLFFAALGMAAPPGIAGTATAFALHFIVLVSPSNHSHVEMTTLLNQAQALLIGVGFAVVVFRLITLRHPRRLIGRILAATTYDLQRLTNRPLAISETWFGGRMADRLLQLARNINLMPLEERKRWHDGLLALDLGNELLHLRACLEGATGMRALERDRFLREFSEALSNGMTSVRADQLDRPAERLQAVLASSSDEPARLAQGAVRQLQRTWQLWCQTLEESHGAA
ncbi:putative membrane protein YccC [Pseudomonas duriflava]|uniref:Putative membrane protein YccC n=1 Tax=Pseudomonas duriflava TaxID=459528 RepID=A0A562QG24_9PSED|nr:FUSC family protein [Pseudomonas duriflava]TWI55694.1 putative membrane protein YccC [Pseudomonas duriflava]